MKKNSLDSTSPILQDLFPGVGPLRFDSYFEESEADIWKEHDRLYTIGMRLKGEERKSVLDLADARMNAKLKFLASNKFFNPKTAGEKLRQRMKQARNVILIRPVLFSWNKISLHIRP